MQIRLSGNIKSYIKLINFNFFHQLALKLNIQQIQSLIFQKNGFFIENIRIGSQPILTPWIIYSTIKAVSRLPKCRFSSF